MVWALNENSFEDSALPIFSSAALASGLIAGLTVCVGSAARAVCTKPIAPLATNPATTLAYRNFIMISLGKEVTGNVLADEQCRTLKKPRYAVSAEI
jgi:hypothetical protein